MATGRIAHSAEPIGSGRLGSELRGSHISFGQLFPGPRAGDRVHADAGDGNLVHQASDTCVKTHTLLETRHQWTVFGTPIPGHFFRR